MEGAESAPPDYSVTGEGPLGPLSSGGVLELHGLYPLTDVCVKRFECGIEGRNDSWHNTLPSTDPHNDP